MKLHPDSPFSFVYVSGEGATHNPGRFTPIFGRVKGQTEKALFDLHKANPNFRPYLVRPAGVDYREHTEIHPFIPHQALYKRAFLTGLNVYKSMLTPTRQMGKVFTELAMSRGEPVEGRDVQMEGRLLPNVAIRRLSGL